MMRFSLGRVGGRETDGKMVRRGSQRGQTEMVWTCTVEGQRRTRGGLRKT